MTDLRTNPLRVTKTVLASLVLLGAVSAHAATYPSRTISMVVPFPAGGPSDVIARIIADHMSKTLGQMVIIENVGGAGGTIGSARVAAATTDG
jgi:tripartite-type tricarboxylate transporter receptor subunit TctC